MRLRLTARQAGGLLLVLGLAGCGTTKMTDSPRAATEMLLTSQAIDYAVGQIDFTPLAGQAVFLDTGTLDKDLVDKGYLTGLVRQQIVAHGGLLMEERMRAVYVVELRAGAIGTDRHSVLVGTPALSLPSVVPGLPTSIPEIAVAKKNDQRGVAKVAVFAYNRVTGRALWQSGTVEATSQSKDLWLLGAGPFTSGTIRRRTELAGQPLPDLTHPADLFGHKAGPGHPGSPNDAIKEQAFPGSDVPAPAAPIPAALLGVTGGPIVGDRPVMRAER
jgi:hypothetical protein